MTRLDEIKARADAIIPGPWRWFGNTATDQVYLGTVDRGRLIILSPDTRATESVFHHDHVESYTLQQARENVIHWCGTHEDPDPTFREDDCTCDAIREFLRSDSDLRDPYAMAPRDLTHPRTGHAWLSRSVQIRADLRLAEPESGDVTGKRKSRGATRLASYRRHVRYEVLGRTLDGHFSDYRTLAEYEAETGKSPEEALYREDFMSIATPEAELIEHAAEDIPWLLNYIAELEHAVAQLRCGEDDPDERRDLDR